MNAGEGSFVGGISFKFLLGLNRYIGRAYGHRYHQTHYNPIFILVLSLVELEAQGVGRTRCTPHVP